jgi:uncharacterized protein (DUF983 family)
MLRRAITLRCPRCGNRKSFIRGWFGRHERCQTCGIRWCREEGFELGALALNTILTFSTLAIAMSIGFIATSPDIPVLPFVLGLAGVAVLMPIFLYPFTYLLWLVIDLRVHEPDAKELADALRHVGTASTSA